MFPQACESRFKRLCYCCLSLVRLPHTLRELVGHVPAGLKSVEARVFLMAWSPCGLLALCELLGYVPAGLVIQIDPGLFLWPAFLEEISVLCELIAGTFLLAFANQFVQVCSCYTCRSDSSDQASQALVLGQSAARTPGQSQIKKHICLENVSWNNAGLFCKHNMLVKLS